MYVYAHVHVCVYIILVWPARPISPIPFYVFAEVYPPRIYMYTSAYRMGEGEWV